MVVSAIIALDIAMVVSSLAPEELIFDSGDWRTSAGHSSNRGSEVSFCPRRRLSFQGLGEVRWFHPPAPKVPNNPLFAGTAPAGAFSNRAGRQKMQGTVVICTFCIPAQHRPNGPFRPHIAATAAQLGVSFGKKIEIHMLQNRGHSWPYPKSSKCPFFLGIDDASRWAMFPILCSGLVWICGQTSCAMLNGTYRRPCTTWFLLWASGWIGAQLQQGLTAMWRQCEMLKASILTAISNVFWLWWGFMKAHVAQGLSWAQLRHQMPDRTKLRMVSPTCVQMRHVGPQLRSSWA